MTLLILDSFTRKTNVDVNLFKYIQILVALNCINTWSQSITIKYLNNLARLVIYNFFVLLLLSFYYDVF